jgi:radical SAM superfamily enzyme YgiQ (UPF0313 family)
MAAVLKRRGHQVRLLAREEQLMKLRMDWDRADAELLTLATDWRPDIVGFSTMTPSMPELARLASLCRQALGPQAMLLAGGPHPTALPHRTLQECPDLDAVALGEAEMTVAELADGAAPIRTPGLVVRNDQELTATPPRPHVADVDSLGPPACELLDLKHYATPNPWMIRWLSFSATNIRTSRGCTNRCSFCAGHLVAGAGVRLHSLDYVMDQIAFATDRMNVQAVHFEDDTLAADALRLAELCERMCRAGMDKRLVWDACLRVDQATPELLRTMRRAGCIQIEFGFESGSDAGLAAIGKRATAEMNRRAVTLAREAGLRVFADIMVGLPGETAAEFRRTERFIEWARPEVLSAARLCPLPGTSVYERLSDRQRAALKWEDFAYMNPPAAACNLTAMSDRKLSSMYRSFERRLVRPLTWASMARDTSDMSLRRRLKRRLRRFALRHPLRAWRLGKLTR